MTMEKNKKSNLDPLKSPLWAYISVAANTTFTPKEKYEIMVAQKKWEKECRKAGKCS